MSNDPTEKPPLEIHSDEDWKKRVKAEDAKLDAERSQSSETSDSESSPSTTQQHAPQPGSEEFPLPPASLEMLVQMFSTQAVVAMGVIPDPTGQQKPNLALARHFIDLLGVVEEKTRGNLSDNEKKLIETTLHEVRMMYIECTRSA